jgi:hypothetical protein
VRLLPWLLGRTAAGVPDRQPCRGVTIDRHRAIQTGVARLVDGAHTALTELRFDGVVSERAANHDGAAPLSYVLLREVDSEVIAVNCQAFAEIEAMRLFTLDAGIELQLDATAFLRFALQPVHQHLSVAA